MADNGHSLGWRLVNGYLNHRYHACRQPALSAGSKIIPLLPPLALQLDYFFRHLDAREAQGKRLLDVGCGNGGFLLRTQQAGWSVHEGAFDALPSRDEFDVVTCSHVIEHVHEPQALLHSMKTYLRPGGTIWLATPNAQSIGHKLFGASWYLLEPPRYLPVFSRQGLADLLARAGFVDVHFHRRGRGAKSLFQQSRKIARENNQHTPCIPGFLVDILATLSARFSEELVVTARKPG
jgi:SAM-dependent methyltransferase